tara:strand:- start:1862 stop:2743 length:882 start_codon:yes stop_codon:yes gene_type:complete
MSLFEKLAALIGNRQVPSLAVPSLPRYRISFANSAVVKIVVFAIVLSGLAVAIGMYFAVKDVVSSTYNWPEPATYHVTADGLQTMGEKNPNMEDGTESQTLSIRLADGARISTLRIKDTDVGRTGIARSLDISPYTSAVTGTQAYLWVGNMTVTNSSFPTLAWQNSEVGTLTTGMLCDGHTMSATVSNTVSDLELSSERQSSVYEVDGSVVDRVQLHITGNTGAYVQNLVIDNLDAWSGQAFFDRMKIGTVTIDNSNRIGDGSGVDSASCVINPSVSARVINNTMQDRPITVR